MAKKNYKNNNNVNRKMSKKTKAVLITVGMILLIFGILVGANIIINRSNNEEGFEKQKVTWELGAIDVESGNMIDDDGFMHSSKINVDTALMIRREYISNISYMVFYYNAVGELVYADVKPENKETNGYVSDYIKNISDIPVQGGEEVAYARVAFEWTNDDNDSLSFFERLDLQKKINVFVAVDSETEE